MLECRGKAAHAAHAGGSGKLKTTSWVLLATSASDGLALRGGRGAGPTVTADSHGVGIEGVHSRRAVGQLDRHLSGLVVGTDSMMGFNVGGFQNGLLSPQVENRKPIRHTILFFVLGTIYHYQKLTH